MEFNFPRRGTDSWDINSLPWLKKGSYQLHMMTIVSRLATRLIKEIHPSIFPNQESNTRTLALSLITRLTIPQRVCATALRLRVRSRDRHLYRPYKCLKCLPWLGCFCLSIVCFRKQEKILRGVEAFIYLSKD